MMMLDTSASCELKTAKPDPILAFTLVYLPIIITTSTVLIDVVVVVVVVVVALFSGGILQLVRKL